MSRTEKSAAFHIFTDFGILHFGTENDFCWASAYQTGMVFFYSSSSVCSSSCSVSTANSFPVLQHTWQNTCCFFICTVLKFQTEVTLIYSVCCPLSHIAVALDCPKPEVTLCFPTCHILKLGLPPLSPVLDLLLGIRWTPGDHVKNN